MELKKAKGILLMIFLLLTLSSVSALTASIGNSRMILHLKPNEPIQRSILVKNTNDIPVNITLSIAEDPEHLIVLLDTHFILQPGEEKNAAFAISSIGEGNYTSHINIEFLPSTGGNAVGLTSTIKSINKVELSENVTRIYDCQNLDKENTVYGLNNPLESNYTCIIINANNITLDLNGFSITGNGNYHAIDTDGFSNITIKNGAIVNFGDGIIFEDSHNNHFQNLQFFNNDKGNAGIVLIDSNNNLIENNYFRKNDGGILIDSGQNNTIINNIIKDSFGNGIHFEFTSNNKIINTEISNSNWNDFYIRSFNDNDCNHIFENVTNGNNEIIQFYNAPVNLSNQKIGGLILCNADNSEIINVTITNKNSNNGLYVLKTDQSFFSNILVNSTYRGVFLYNSNNNSFDALSSLFNQESGLYLKRSENNQFMNSSILSNFEGGVIFDVSKGNILSKSFVVNNTGEVGIFVDHDSSDNLIYNNLINNSYNFDVSDDFKNLWNLSVNQIPLGGNYWASPEGLGFSETCTDSNLDGFCDDPFVINENNIDFLPLTNSLTKTLHIENVTIIYGENAGEEWKIQATIFNPGIKVDTFDISVSSPDNWFTNTSLTPQSFELGPGESQDVNFTFYTYDNVSGVQLFYFIIYSNGKEVTRKPVVLPIETKLSVRILIPSDHSIINTNTKQIIVETNQDATCEFSFGHSISFAPSPCVPGQGCEGGYGGGGASAYRQMNVTGSQNHSDVIENLHETINNATQNETYNVRIKCRTGTQEVIETSYFTVNYSYVSDTTSPTMALQSPSNGYSTTDNEILFSYIPSDESPIDYCELFIDNQQVAKTTDIINNTENYFGQTLSRDDYTWYITCTDEYGNIGQSSTRSFEIKKKSSSSGGGRSSSSNSNIQYISNNAQNNDDSNQNEAMVSTNNFVSEPISLGNSEFLSSQGETPNNNQFMIILAIVVICLLLAVLFLFVK